MSRAVEMPWNPATTATAPAASVSRIRSPLTSRILALPWSVSVTIPAWTPVKLTAWTPRSMIAMQSSAIEIRSPAVRSMSSSRPCGSWATSWASRTRSSVVLPIAETTTIDLVALAMGPDDVVGDGPDPIRVRDRGPAVLLDDDWHATRVGAALRPSSQHIDDRSLPECAVRSPGGVVRMRRTRLTALVLAVLIGVGLLPAASAGADGPEAGRRRRRSPSAGSVHQVHVIDAPPGTGVELRRRDRTDPDRPRPTTSAATSSATSTPAPATRSCSAPAPAPSALASRCSAPTSAAAVALLAASTSRSTTSPPRAATATSPPATARRSRSRSCCPGPADKGPVPDRRRVLGLRPVEPDDRPAAVQARSRPRSAWPGSASTSAAPAAPAARTTSSRTSRALDGYDAIETVAAQPWSTGRVGMVGISFAGISQLFVARTQPPHLDAITPALGHRRHLARHALPRRHLQRRLREGLGRGAARPEQVAEPRRARLGEGRASPAATPPCADNMQLRGQNVDLQEQTEAHPFFSALDPQFRYDFPDGGDSLAPQAVREGHQGAGVHRRCLAGRADRRPLGRTCSTASPRRRRSAPSARTACTPSRSTRPCSPRSIEFLDFYVAQKVPTIPPGGARPRARDLAVRSPASAG